MALKQGPTAEQLRAMNLKHDPLEGIVATSKPNWKADQYSFEAGFRSQTKPAELPVAPLADGVNVKSLKELQTLHESLQRSRALLRQMDNEIAYFAEKRRSIQTAPLNNGALDAYLTSGATPETRLERLAELVSKHQRDREQQAAVVAEDERRYTAYQNKVERECRARFQKALKTIKDAAEVIVKENDAIDSVVDLCRSAGFNITDENMAFQPLRRPAVIEKGRLKVFQQNIPTLEMWLARVKKAGFSI
jgi:hypothetical protein